MSQPRTPVGPRPPLPTPLRPEVVGYPRTSLDGQRQWRALRKGGRSDVVTLTPRCAQVNTARPRTSTPPQHTYMQSRLDHSRSERHRSRVRTSFCGDVLNHKTHERLSPPVLTLTPHSHSLHYANDSAFNPQLCLSLFRAYNSLQAMAACRMAEE